jgi:hypothetical protein
MAEAVKNGEVFIITLDIVPAQFIVSVDDTEREGQLVPPPPAGD